MTSRIEKTGETQRPLLMPVPILSSPYRDEGAEKRRIQAKSENNSLQPQTVWRGTDIQTLRPFLTEGMDLNSNTLFGKAVFFRFFSAPGKGLPTGPLEKTARF